jgi:hypothetical protein
MPRTLTVAERPRGVDTSSWDSVHRLGTDGEVVEFLKRAPKLQGLSVDIIGSRLMAKPDAARKEFYTRVRRRGRRGKEGMYFYKLLISK